jgi:NitT/TauT family transport system substrate-binding protein
MRRRTFVQSSALFALGAALPSGLTACSQPSASKPGQPMIVGLIPWIGYGAHYIASAKGFFAAEGLTVEDAMFQTVSDENTAILSGKADMALMCGLDLLGVSTQSTDIKAIMMTDYSDGADGVVARGINQLADLRGAKIAREDAPYHHVFVNAMLTKAGLTEQDVELVTMTAADAATAFIAGQIDVAACYEPFLSKAIKEGKGTQIFSSKSTNIVPNLVAVRQAVMTDRKTEVLAYMRAFNKATILYQSGDPEALAIVGKVIGVTAAEVKEQLKNDRIMNIEESKTIAFDEKNGLSLLGSMKKGADVLHNLKKTPALVDASAIVDDSLLKLL